jgi:hypothetical protein
MPCTNTTPTVRTDASLGVASFTGRPAIERARFATDERLGMAGV